MMNGRLLIAIGMVAPLALAAVLYAAEAKPAADAAKPAEHAHAHMAAKMSDAQIIASAVKAAPAAVTRRVIFTMRYSP